MANNELPLRPSPAIGIDLGTTYSCVAIWDRDYPKIIINDQGNRTTPSYVSFTDEEIFAGDVAREYATMDPTNTIYAVKRLIGRRFSDPCVNKDNNLRRLRPFTVVPSTDDKPQIVVQYRGKEKQFSAEEISAMILKKMKQIAEKFLRCTVKDAVITVPAYFSDSQRRATKEAGILAGLNVKRLMDEPIAAALAYGYKKIKYYTKPQNVCVFDLGGGTFDISVVNVSGDHFEVKATAGDTHLGGEDFDNRILIYCVEEFNRKYKKHIVDKPKALRRLRCACERAKRWLSTATMATIQVDYLYQDLDFTHKLSRDKFNELNMDLFAKCIELTDKCLKDAKVNRSDVDIVVLSGGSSRIPKVQELLEEYFGEKKVHRDINPDEAVAHGAAILAAKLSGQGSELINNVVLTNVNPLSLGTELTGDVMQIIIPRNTPIPTKKVCTISTGKDNQISMFISLYEGERIKASSNNLLGELVVSGISPAPRGDQQVDLCFEIDADGILNVSATVRGSGQMSKLQVTNEESWLRKETIDKMMNDAEKSKTEDEERKRRSDAWHKLNWYIVDTRRTMRTPELVSLISEFERKKMEDQICEAFRWLDLNAELIASVEASESKLREIKKTCEPIIAKMK